MDQDIELLDRFIDGDQESFEELVRKYQKPLYSFIWRMVNNHDDASDILQKTFVQAFTGLKRFERRSSFKTWLYQIAMNLTKNHYRDRGRVDFVSLDDVVIKKNPRTLENLIQKETRTALRSAMTALPEKQRITVLLRVQENKTFEEIASIMQCTIGTSKANYHHGVQKLKTIVSEQDNSEVQDQMSGETDHVRK